MACPRLTVTSEDVPEEIKRLHGRQAMAEQTCGDGACAIHSVFGELHRRGFYKASARSLLRHHFGPAADVFTIGVNDAHTLLEIRHALWQELLQPCAAQEAGLHDGVRARKPEGEAIWAVLKNKNPEVACECVEALRSERVRYTRFMATRVAVADALGALCTRPMEHVFIRPLLRHLGMLQEYVEESVCPEDAARSLSKYGALFAHGALSRRLHQGIVERCGVNNFHVLHEKVVDIVGAMDDIPEEIFTFAELLHGAQHEEIVVRHEPFDNFFEAVYPSYLDAICAAEPQYWLSDVELIALCRCARVNVVIFKHDTVHSTMSYLRHCIMDNTKPLLLSSILVDPRAAHIRTHFEKLSLTPERPLPPAGPAEESEGTAGAAHSSKSNVSSGSGGGGAAQAESTMGSAHGAGGALKPKRIQGHDAGAAGSAERNALSGAALAPSAPDTRHMQEHAEGAALSAESNASAVAALAASASDARHMQGHAAGAADCAESNASSGAAQRNALSGAAQAPSAPNTRHMQEHTEGAALSAESNASSVAALAASAPDARHMQGHAAGAADSVESNASSGAAQAPSVPATQHMQGHAAGAAVSPESNASPGAVQAPSASDAQGFRNRPGGRDDTLDDDEWEQAVQDANHRSYLDEMEADDVDEWLQAVRDAELRAYLDSLHNPDDSGTDSDNNDSDEDDVFHVGTLDEASFPRSYSQCFLYGWKRAISELALHLRDNPLAPQDCPTEAHTYACSDAKSGNAWPVWHCPFIEFGLGGHTTPCLARAQQASSDSQQDYSHEKDMWTHVRACHGHTMEAISQKWKLQKQELVPAEVHLTLLNSALAEKERATVPKLGHSTDRRSLRQVDEVFRDDTVSVLMCFQCACKEISYSGFDKFGQRMQKGNICYRDDRRREVLQIIAGDPNGAAEEAWSYNMCAKRYKDHFGQAVATDPDMDDSSFEWFRNVKRQGGVERILCCPEDVMRTSSCRHGDTFVCEKCSIPICNECFELSQKNMKIPRAVANDNFIGYMHSYIVQNKVTWLEATIPCPVFSGLVTYYIEGDASQRGHMMQETLGSPQRAWAVRGNLFSFLLPWEKIMAQLSKCFLTGDFREWPLDQQTVCEVVRVRIVRAKQQATQKYRELTVRSKVVKHMANIYMERHIKDLGQRPRVLKLLPYDEASNASDTGDVTERLRGHIEARIDA